MSFSYLKALILCIIFCGITFSNVYADEIVKVRRGDSWETIAEKYGISSKALKEANGDIVECYMGMEIRIPENLLEEAAEKKRIEQEKADNDLLEAEYNKASEFIQAGKLKKAKKVYDKIIKTHPSTRAYYWRGIVESDLHKWSAVMNDLDYVMRQPDCTDNMYNKCVSLYNHAAQSKAEADAKKEELVAGLLGLATTTLTIATTAAVQSNAQKREPRHSSSSSPSRSSNYSSSTSSSRHSSSSSTSRHSSSTSKHSSSTPRHSASKSTSRRNTSTSTPRRSTSTSSSRHSSSSSSSRRSTSTPRRNSSNHSNRYANTTSQYKPSKTAKSSNQTPTTSSMSFEEQYRRYLSPEAFVYNYTHGLPTLPTSSDMGLTGTDAYAYDLETKLQYDSQQMDLFAEKHTQELVAQGMKQAQEEIENFSKIYGREPTAEEIQDIYRKYTQGYVDAYKEYVTETVATNEELGLGKIERSKPTAQTSDASDNENSDNSSALEEEKEKEKDELKDKENKDKENKSREKDKKEDPKKNNKDKEEEEHPTYGRYTQKKVTIYNWTTPKTDNYKGCKVYQKGPVFYVKVNGDFLRVSKSQQMKYKYKVIVGSKEYHFNMP